MLLVSMGTYATGENNAPDVGLEPTTLGYLEHFWLAM